MAGADSPAPQTVFAGGGVADSGLFGGAECCSAIDAAYSAETDTETVTGLEGGKEGYGYGNTHDEGWGPGVGG